MASLDVQGGVNSLQQVSVTLRQLQLMQQQAQTRLNDIRSLAHMPPNVQQITARQMNLDPNMLTPEVLSNQTHQLETVLQQYQLQISQVEVQQQRLHAHVQQQMQLRHAQLQQQQQQHHHHHQQQQQQQHQHQHGMYAQHHMTGVHAPQPQAGQQAYNTPQAQLAQLQHRNQQMGQGYGMQVQQQAHRQPTMFNSGRLGSLQQPQHANHYAQQPAYANGNRFAPQAAPANRKRRHRDDSPEPMRGYGAVDAKPTRESVRSRKRVNYAEAEGLADITDDELEDAGLKEDDERKQKQKNAVAAFDDTSELDDEVEKVLAHRDRPDMELVPEDPYANKEFYVKWRHWSHIHCSWDTRETLFQLAGYKRVKNYIKRMEDLDRRRRVLSREEIELIDVERQMEYEMSLQHQVIERIIAEKADPTGGEKRYLCKFQGLPYGENTWELASGVHSHGGQAQVDEYLQRESRATVPAHTVDYARRMLLSQHRALEAQPAYLQGGQLRDYQLQSLNWMIFSWMRGVNIILADEMGLGKTVQCASLIGYFSEVLKIFGPFLIVVPLSTIPNWIREFRKWIPNVNAVVYVGDTKSREVIREFEFPGKGRADREHKFEVLITTYELVLKDSEVLSQIRWNFLVVDEAHRLKNNESALYRELRTWPFKNKLLVTGTPLQNSIKELWALLHFLEPFRFPSLEEFEMKYDLKNSESVNQLHRDLQPHLLRRVIKDVEKSLPPKNERILRVDMTPLQRQYYKWILTRNFKELNKGSRAQVTLLNIISDLKKCCNHPFLFESAEEEYKGRDETSMIDRLVRTSGKMVLLDKLLSRLKSAGHRVLLFSQMVHMLDIISDYMRMKGWQHQRLDGSTPSQQRHQAMEQFNAEGSKDFAFLLSTRAGGLGINLATADTVIIFDSDWNPQNDLQAMSRAHRIGQRFHVNIYRFVTMGSVEQDILERAKRKMVLDHVIIQRMDTSGRTVLEGQNAGKEMFDKGELAAILRFGAENLFAAEKGDKQAIEEVQKRDENLYEEDLDDILARAEVVDQRMQEEAEDKKNELLSSFNVATFKNDEDDATFWNRLITDEQRAAAPERKKASATGEEGAARGGGRRGDGAGKGRKRQPRQPIEANNTVTIEVTQWPDPCDINGSFVPLAECDAPWMPPADNALPRKEAAAFLKAVKRHARIEKIGDICADVGGLAAAAPVQAQLALWYAVVGACDTALAAVEAQGLEPKDAMVEFFNNSQKALEMAQTISAMRIVGHDIAALSDPYTLYRLDATTQVPPPKWASANNWCTADDSKLLLGCYMYGIGSWDELAADERLELAEKLQGAVREGAHNGDKTWPQGSHMETRALALLRKVERVRNPGALYSKPGRKKRAGAGGNQGKDGKETRAARGAARSRRGAASADDDNDRELHEVLCRTALQAALPEMRKLRLLGRSTDLEEQRVLNKTRKYILAVGDAIANVEAAGGTALSAEQLWDFVSEFTENTCSGAKLKELHGKLAARRNPAATAAAPAVTSEAAAPAGADGAAAAPMTNGFDTATAQTAGTAAPALKPNENTTDGPSPDDSQGQDDVGASDERDELLAAAGGGAGGAGAGPSSLSAGASASALNDDAEDDDDDGEEEEEEEEEGSDGESEGEGDEDDDWQA